MMEQPLQLAELHQNLGQYITISTEETEFFISRLKQREISNRRFLLKQGEFCQSFYLVAKGCLINYFIDKKGYPHVLQFATRMRWTSDLNSLLYHKPSSYNIQASGNSLVYQMDKEVWDLLNLQIPRFERYFRIIFQNALIAHQNRIIQNISETAEQRYLTFIKTYPEVVQRVPLKYIASYLGITPEFLSKVRRNLSKR